MISEKADRQLIIRGFLFLNILGIIGITCFGYQKHQQEIRAVAGEVHYYDVLYGSEEQGFKKPMGVVLDEKDGEIYVSDADLNLVIAKSRYGTSRIIGASETLRFPLDLVFGDGLFYVGDLYNGRVRVLTPGGREISVIPGPEERSKTGAIRPLSLALDESQNLYVFDTAKQKVLIFDRTGKLKASFGSAGSGQGQFNFVNGMVVDNRRKLIYLADSNNSRIQVFSLEGEFIRSIEEIGQAKNRLILPRGLALEEEHNILFVSDMFANTVYIYDLNNNRVVRKITRGGPEGTALLQPNDVYYSEKYNQILIADKGNQRVLIFKYAPKSEADEK